MQAIWSGISAVCAFVIGKAIARFFVTAVVGMGTYGLSKFVLLPVLLNFSMGTLPDIMICAGGELGIDNCISVILASYTARLTLAGIKWGSSLGK